MGLFGPPDVQKLKSKQDYRGLAKALCSSDPGVRGEAVKAIVDLASPEAVPAIAEAVSGNEDEQVISSVSQALCGIGDPAVSCLTEIIRRDRTKRRATAVALLGRMGEQYGLAPLRELISEASQETVEDITLRTFATLSLGIIGSNSAMETVIELLADPTSPVRLAAATELEAHPDQRAVEPLRRATNDESPAVRKQAEESLAALGKA